MCPGVRPAIGDYELPIRSVGRHLAFTGAGMPVADMQQGRRGLLVQVEGKQACEAKWICLSWGDAQLR
jgi:hypothetical protein